MHEPSDIHAKLYPHRGTRGVDWLPPPWVFDTLQYFETILTSVESLWSSLYKMTYILLVVALLEVCDVTKNGRHLGSHLGFYQKLNSGENSKNKQFLRLTSKITKIITLHHFIHKLYFYFWKKLKKHTFSLKNSLTTCYLWRHIS